MSLPDRAAGLAHDRVDGALQLADVRRSSRSASSGSWTASASSRSAVTGVRSRWDRSATAARSAASSSPIRSASRLSATRRARRSPAGRAGRRGRRGRPRASRCGHRGQLGHRRADPAAEPVGDQQRQREQHQAERRDAEPGPRSRPRCSCASATTVRPRRCRRPVDDRHAAPAPPRRRRGERPAGARRGRPGPPPPRPAGRRARVPSASEHRWCRGPRWSTAGDQPAELRVGRARPETRIADVARLLVGRGQRPVLGHRAHQQAQRDQERRGRPLMWSPRPASEIRRRIRRRLVGSGSTSRTPTPRTVCR